LTSLTPEVYSSPTAVAFSDVVDKIVKAPQQRLNTSALPSEKLNAGANQNGTGVAPTNNQDNDDQVDLEVLFFQIRLLL
jgi:hypothetical protein